MTQKPGLSRGVMLAAFLNAMAIGGGILLGSLILPGC